MKCTRNETYIENSHSVSNPKTDIAEDRIKIINPGMKNISNYFILSKYVELFHKIIYRYNSMFKKYHLWKSCSKKPSEPIENIFSN